MSRFLPLLLLFIFFACYDTPDPTAPPNDGSVFASRGGLPGAEPFVEGRVLVRFAPGADRARVAASHGGSVDRELLLGGVWAVSVPAGRELAVTRALSNNPNVVFAEPDFIRTFGEPCKSESGTCMTPDDTYFGLKWDLHNDGTVTISGSVIAFTGKVDADMDWLEAFDLLGGSYTGSARIGILDTGIRHTHEALVGRIAVEYDFFDNNSNAADDHGHGTHVAGIAAASGNDGKGLPGVAWGPNMELAIGKVCGPIRRGPFVVGYGCPLSAIADGIVWAADEDAHVINLSLGGPSGSSTEQEALEYARGKGSLPICAAGNDGANQVLYPAAWPECVAVSATNWSDELASYSNYGPEIELSAPGGDVEDWLGFSYIASAYYAADDDYVFMAGTSMAAPQVSGLAGLLAALGLEGNEQILAHMKATADDLGAEGWDPQYGYGRINVFNAVRELDSNGSGGGDAGDDPSDPTEPNEPPVASFTYECTELECSFIDTSTDSDGSVVAWSWDFGDGATSTEQDPTHTYGEGGTYTVKLTVTDDAGDTDTAEQDVTVTAPDTGDPPETGTVTVASVAYSWHGGPNRDRHLTVTITIHDDAGAPVPNASVTGTLTNTNTGASWSLTGTTGSDGQVSFSRNNAPNGCYSTEVNSVDAGDLDWDGEQGEVVGDNCK